MLSDRFKALEDVIAQLPIEAQDALAAALEDALKQVAPTQAPLAPRVASEVRAAIDRALAQHEASLRYLRDK